MTYITGGQRYGVSKTGGTVCLGPAGDLGDTLLTPLACVEQGDTPVSKSLQVVDALSSGPAIRNGVIMKHPGRPKKEGEVSRVTAWRRSMEDKQAVLAI